MNLVSGLKKEPYFLNEIPFFTGHLFSTTAFKLAAIIL